MSRRALAGAAVLIAGISVLSIGRTVRAVMQGPPDPCELAGPRTIMRVGASAGACNARWGFAPQDPNNPNSPRVWRLISSAANPGTPAVDVAGSGIWANLLVLGESVGSHQGMPFAFENQPGVNWTDYDNGTWGSNHNVSLMAPLSTGDFLDPMPTLGESSLCLLPPGAAGMSTGWMGLSRPTLHQSVDLVTGLPLVHVTDLALPFGGAEFRLNRTRSATHINNHFGRHLPKWEPSQEDRWWDWTGLGWMASENPLLVVDSTAMNLVGDNAPTTWLVLDAYHSIPFQLLEGTGRYEAPPRFRARLTHDGQYGVVTYATGDARHAIWPQGRYGWITPPTWYEVSLYDGEVTYRFLPVRDDIPRHYWNARDFVRDPELLWGPETPESPWPTEFWVKMGYDERPIRLDAFAEMSPVPGDLPQVAELSDNIYDWSLQPGAGMPALGLCTEIRDRNQHRVEIAYADVVRRDMDNPASTGCVECQTDGPGKGRIKAIRLWTGTQLEWTLVYVNRWFARCEISSTGLDGLLWDTPDTADPSRYEQWGTAQIDSIFAFKGETISPQTSIWDLPTIDLHHTDGAGFDVFTNPLAGTGLPTTWTHRVQYQYNLFPNGTTPTGGDKLCGAEDRPTMRPLLVMRSLQTKAPTDPSAQSSGTTTRQVYVYNDPGNVTATTAPYAPSAEDDLRTTVWLEAVLDDEVVGRLLSEGVTTRVPDPQNPGQFIESKVALSGLRELALMRTSTAWGDHGLPEEVIEGILASASVSMKNGGGVQFYDASAGATGTPALTPSLHSLCLQPGVNNEFYLDSLAYTDGNGASNIQQDTHWSSVAELRARVGGKVRYYRIHRYRACPVMMPGGPRTELGVPNGHWMYEYDPQASAFVAPYAWHASFAGSGHGSVYEGNPNGVGVPDDLIPRTAGDFSAMLEQRRWVTIIDEFGDLDSLRSTSEYDSVTGLKPGMTSRRVVELNPSGVVMGDRTWTIDAATGQLQGSGTSLGVKYAYKTVEQLFGSSLPAVCEAPVGRLTDPETPQSNPCSPDATTRAFRNEMLLVERRSVSWSAANSIAVGQTRPYGETEGLVEFYEYGLLTNPIWTFTPDDANGRYVPWEMRVKPVARGVQRGSPATPNPSKRAYQQQMFYGADPSAPSCTVTFLTSNHGLLASEPTLAAFNPQSPPTDMVYTFTEVVRRAVSDPNVQEWQKPIESVTAIGSPQKARPTGPWLYPVTRTIMDTDGRTVWVLTGLVSEPKAPTASGHSMDTAERLVLNFTGHGPDGPAVEVVDADPAGTYYGAQSNGADDQSHAYAVNYSSAPASSDWMPTGGVPGSGGSPQYLQYKTRTLYDWWGMCDQFFHSGKRWARRIVVNDPTLAQGDEYAEQFTFPALVHVGDAWTTLAPCRYDRYSGPGTDTRIEHSITIHLTAPIPDFYIYAIPGVTPGTAAGWNDWNRTAGATVILACEPQQGVRFGLDAAGRPANAELLEPDLNGVPGSVGSMLVNELVDVRRERAIDGNVSRLTRDLLGHPKRKYEGTIDTAWSGDGVVDPPMSVFDLIMTERTEWGNGQPDPNAPPAEFEQQINSTWQRTLTRRYDRRPAAGWDQTAFYADPVSDPDGFITKTYYDWRRRAVRSDRFDRGDVGTAVRAQTTLTFLDHLDRPVLVVDFGRGSLALSAGMDPARLDVQDALPTATSFFTQPQGILPISARATTYDASGHATAVKTYRPTPAQSGLPYVVQSEESGYGFGGQMVYSRRTDGQVSVTTVDGLARPVREAVIIMVASAEFEMAATLSELDDEGNVRCSRRLERLDNPLAQGAAATLAATGGSINAARSRTVNWYDAQNRLIAAADLGTEATSFSPGAEAFSYSATTPPTLTEAGVYAAPSGMPANAAVTVNLYNRAGQNILRRDPNGSCTRTEYDLGQVSKVTENCFATDLRERRITRSNYKWGRLIEMAVEDGVGSPETPAINQRTVVIYGAEVVDDAFVRQSANNALVGKVYLTTGTVGARHVIGNPQPNPATDPADLTFRYTFGGKIAERIDKRGLSLRYSYDSLERLSEIEVGYYDSSSVYHLGYPADPYSTVGSPPDRVGYVSFSYDAAGRLIDTVAKTLKAAPVAGVISHDQCAYDAFGSLLSEIQSHGEFPASGYIPTINYSWTYAPAQDGTLQVEPRLAWMQYPTPPNGTSGARKVSMTYGTSSTTADSILSRITQFSTALGTGTSSGVAGLSYVGTSRRSKLTLAESTAGTGLIVTDFDGGGSLGLENLDGFGRPKKLAAMRASATLFSADYTYDAAGNRTTAKLVQATEGSQTQVNKRSQINGYDSLMRLSGTQVGQVDFDANGVPSIHSGTSVRSDTWWMDAIGNFNGGYRTGNPYGRDGTAAIDLAGHTAVRYVTNKRNEITSATYRTASNGTESVTFAYDKAGNLIFDGSYYYQYDAWNRLVQINPATPVIPQQGFVPGNPEDEPVAFTVSATVIKHFVYDGAGRLIQTLSPYPNPQATSGLVRLERYFYDGVRRIQEVNSDGVTTLNGAQGGDSQTQQAASQSTAAQGSTSVSGGTSPTGLANVVIRAHPQGTYLNHEYIWGPGDRGIDELLVEYDFGRKAWYALVDGGGDVVALCDKSGSGVSSNATVGAQWTYDAYGNVVTAWVRDTDVPASFVGHKGLFAERLDVGVATSTSGYDSVRLSPMATVLYHNRNRAYSPVLGRFIQSDPNASGVSIELSELFHGDARTPEVGNWETQSHYADGLSVFAYLGNSPWQRRDSLGLFILDLFGPSSLLEFETDNMQDVLERGKTLRDAVSDIGEDAAYAMEIDVHWAVDWSRDDFAFSRAGEIGYERDRGDSAQEPNGFPLAAGSSPMAAARLYVPIWQKAKLIANGHHLIPKFLGGAANVAKRFLHNLPRWKHEKFHSMLNNVLKLRGFPAANNKEAWEILRTGMTAAQKKQLRRILYDTSRHFEEAYNVPGFASAVATEILRQRW